MDEAAAHDRAAAAHERAANEARRSGSGGYACGDRALSDQTTTGGEPVTRWVPCWSVEQEGSAEHEAAAERLRTEAREHRAIARTLVDVERTFCAILVDDELTHTPLFHRDDIASVEPYREDDRVVGARVTFKRVRGLDADYLRQALLCHRARMATLGYPATYMAYDPSMLAHSHIAVDERGGPVVLTVRGDDEVTAAVVWSRAEALVGAR
ncbi:MAG: hypothetical protein IPL61_26230 [Myxococcales bacterium]|nr:hypothetical protein [Myxococcales bacterium]